MAHGRGGQHFPHEQERQPAGAFLDHGHEPDLQIGGVESLHAAELLDVLSGLALCHVEHVVHRDHSQQHAAGVHDGQHRHVVFLELTDRRLLVVRSREGKKCSFKKLRDGLRRIRSHHALKADPVDQPARRVDDVELVQCQTLALPPNPSQMVQNGRDRP